MSIKFDMLYTKDFINDSELEKMQSEVKKSHDILHSGKGISEGITGWLDLPVSYDKEEFERVKICAEKIRNNSDILIVIGIGGSYLGTRAAIEFLNSPNYNFINKNSPKILFAGNNISSLSLLEIMEICKDKEVSLNVVSKSGATTEPAIAFRILKKFMENKYGDGAKERIYCTTDKHIGTLRELANSKGYETFTIPSDIGGRYSVLSSVGLLPIAVSGKNIDEIMHGAASAEKRFMEVDIEKNDCYKYAAVRNLLYKKGKMVEILSSYDPKLALFLEWWKQLYGESEGKDGKGIFPTSAMFTTDLHSIGQFIQDGSRIMFETSLIIENESDRITLGVENNGDGLDFLSGKTLSYVNKMAFKGTALAHYEGGVPGLVISIDNTSERDFGELVYFFEKSCAISGLILGINPFNQPGVEAYKNKMFALLGKPGH